MSNDELATIAGHGAARRLEVRRVIGAAIEQTWAAITSPEELALWWKCEVLEPREGGRIQRADAGLNGTVKVMQAPYIFEFTWDDVNVAPGLVRFDLVEVGDGETLVTLVQYIPASHILGAAAGWHEILERLGTYIDTGVLVPPSEGDSRFEELKRVYQAAGVSWSLPSRSGREPDPRRGLPQRGRRRRRGGRSPSRRRRRRSRGPRAG